MESIILHQLTCPNCGRHIASFNAFTGEAECPYCHQMVRTANALAVQRPVMQPELLIPFKTSLQDLGQRLVNALIKRRYVPNDIFNFLSAENAIKVYLPMYLYEGTFHSKWTGVVRDRVTDSDGRTSTERSYVRGTVRDSFAVMALACDPDQLPSELAQFAKECPYVEGVAQPFNAAAVAAENVATAEPVTTAEALWEQVGNAKVDDVIDKMVRHDAPSNIEKLKYDTLIDKSHNGRLVLVPFWFVRYSYRQQQFYFLMDGTGRKEELNAPVDTDQKKEANKYNFLYWIAALVIVAGVVCQHYENPVALFLLGLGLLGLIATFIFDRMRRKKFHKAAEQVRKEGAARFLGQ